jgi:hypothetical protein
LISKNKIGFELKKGFFLLGRWLDIFREAQIRDGAKHTDRNDRIIVDQPPIHS